MIVAFSAGAQTSQWGRFFERLRVDESMHRLSAASKPADAAFVGADVVPMTSGTTLLRDQTVIVRRGRIEAMGPRTRTKIPRGMRRIDARGRVLFPGLTDAHVHTLVSTGDYLLDLVNGVTTVRERDGFPCDGERSGGTWRSGLVRYDRSR